MLCKETIITEKNQELLSKEEKIRGLELYIREKSYLFESEIDFSQVRFFIHLLGLIHLFCRRKIELVINSSHY